MSLPTPNTRKEQYLNAIATGNASGLPTPITREEEYLDAIAKSGGGSGDGDMKKSVYDSDLDVAGAGGIKAFVNSAVAGKVDKVEGKGLSTNDYTDEDKAIVNGVTGALATKQDVLTFDDEPTANSNNPVKSGGIFDVVNAITGSLSDNAPYILRKALGNLAYEKIVGCSFVKNQLVDDSYKSDLINFNSSTGVYSFTLTPATYTIFLYTNYPFTHISGHKYLYIFTCFSNINSSFRFYGEISGYDLMSFRLYDQSKSFIHNATVTEGCNLASYGEVNIERSAEFKFISIDLTQMFDTEIADYAYSLEQAEAGSGIAWLKSYGFFAENYIAYNAGSIESVSTSGKRVVGKNLLDPSKSTINTASAIFFKNNNILFKGGVTYTASYKGSITPTIYFAMPGTAGSYVTQATKILSFTPEEDCYGWIQFVKVGGGLDIDITKYQLEIGSTATNYEPYKEVVYPLSNRNLLGVPKLVSGHIAYDGDIYDADGGVSEKYDIVDMGTLNWSYSDGIFSTNLSDSKIYQSGNLPNMLCSICPTGIYSIRASYSTITAFMVDTLREFQIRHSGYTSVEDFVAFLTSNNAHLVYEKATPTTASAIPFQNPQRAFIDGTEEFIDAEVPVGHESTYYLNEIAPEIEDYADAKVKMAMSEITCQETTEGDYTLKATVDENGKVTYSWEAVTP